MLLPLADATASQLQRSCGGDPDALCREILDRTGNRALAEIGDFVVGTPLTIVLILGIALIVNKVIGGAIARGLRSLSSGIVRERMSAVRRHTPVALLEASATSVRAEQRLSALTSVLRSVTGFVIMLLATFMVLAQLGVDIGPLLAGAGVLGVALGFGSQSLVKDFLSGLFILAEDQFGVGDVVDLDGQTSGTVEAVSLRTTRLRAVDGTVWYVPNGAIGRVGNRSQDWSRAPLDVEVADDAAAPDAPAPPTSVRAEGASASEGDGKGEGEGEGKGEGEGEGKGEGEGEGEGEDAGKDEGEGGAASPTAQPARPPEPA